MKVDKCLKQQCFWWTSVSGPACCWGGWHLKHLLTKIVCVSFNVGSCSSYSQASQRAAGSMWEDVPLLILLLNWVRSLKWDAARPILTELDSHPPTHCHTAPFSTCSKLLLFFSSLCETKFMFHSHFSPPPHTLLSQSFPFSVIYELLNMSVITTSACAVFDISWVHLYHWQHECIANAYAGF